MTSLRTALSVSTDRRKMPAFPPGDIGALAKVLGLAPPVSVAKGLFPALNNLPFDTVTISSGPMTANFVHGSAQVGMQSNGNVSFRMHAEERGVTGDNFLLTAILGIKDTGATLVFAHQDSLAGTLNVGDSSADFQLDTNLQAIADQWDTAKNSNVQFKLHVSTDPFQLTEGFLGGFLLVGLVKLIKEIANSSVNCSWSSQDPQSGEMTQCASEDEGDEGDEGGEGEEEG